MLLKLWAPMWLHTLIFCQAKTWLEHSCARKARRPLHSLQQPLSCPEVSSLTQSTKEAGVTFTAQESFSLPHGVMEWLFPGPQMVVVQCRYSLTGPSHCRGSSAPTLMPHLYRRALCLSSLFNLHSSGHCSSGTATGHT